MYEGKAFRRKVVGLAAAVAVGTAVAVGADNPHVEQRQNEEEPRLTYENAYTTTSVTMLNTFFDYELYLTPSQPIVRLKK